MLRMRRFLKMYGNILNSKDKSTIFDDNDPINSAISLIKYALQSYTVNSIDMLDKVFEKNTNISKEWDDTFNVFVEDNLSTVLLDATFFYMKNAEALNIAVDCHTFKSIIASYHLSRLIKSLQTPFHEKNVLKNNIESIIKKISEYNEQLKKVICQGNEINYYSFIVGPLLDVPQEISQDYNEQLWEIAEKSQNFQTVQALVTQESFPHYQSADALCQAMLKHNHLIAIVLEQPQYLEKIGFNLTISQAYQLLAIAYKENQKEALDLDKKIEQFEKLIITSIENEAIKQYEKEPKKLIEIMTNSIGSIDQSLLQKKLALLKNKTAYAQYITGSIWGVRKIVMEVCEYLEPRDVCNLGQASKTLKQKIFSKSDNGSSIFFQRLFQHSQLQLVYKNNIDFYSDKPTSRMIRERGNTLKLPTIFSSWRHTYMAAQVWNSDSLSSKVKIWCMESFDCIATLECEKKGGLVTSINKLKGTCLALGNESGVVSLWDFLEQKMIHSYSLVELRPYFSGHKIIGVIDQDESIVVILTASYKTRLCWVNKALGNIEAEIAVSTEKITVYKLISNNRIILGFADGVVQIRDLNSKLPNTITIATFKDSVIKDVVLLNTTQLLCLLQNSNKIHLFNLTDNNCEYVRATDVTGIIACMTVIDDNTLLISQYGLPGLFEFEAQGFTEIYKIAANGEISVLKGGAPKEVPIKCIDKLAALPDGRLLRPSKDEKGIEVLTYPVLKEIEKIEEIKESECTIF